MLVVHDQGLYRSKRKQGHKRATRANLPELTKAAPEPGFCIAGAQGGRERRRRKRRMAKHQTRFPPKIGFCIPIRDKLAVYCVTKQVFLCVCVCCHFLRLKRIAGSHRVYTYMYMDMYMYMYTYTYTYMYMRMYTHMHMHIHMYICICVCAPRSSRRGRTNTGPPEEKWGLHSVPWKLVCTDSCLSPGCRFIRRMALGLTWRSGALRGARCTCRRLLGSSLLDQGVRPNAGDGVSCSVSLESLEEICAPSLVGQQPCDSVPGSAELTGALGPEPQCHAMNRPWPANPCKDMA